MRVARSGGDTAWHLDGRLGGAVVGLVIGTIVGIAGSFASQWWLLLSIPVGGTVGSLVEASIRPGQRIPRRTIVAAALLADVLGAYAVAAVMLATEPHLGDNIAGDGPIVDVVLFGTTALAYAGVWMLFVTGPCAAAGAVLLRQLRASYVRRVAN